MKWIDFRCSGQNDQDNSEWASTTIEPLTRRRSCQPSPRIGHFLTPCSTAPMTVSEFQPSRVYSDLVSTGLIWLAMENPIKIRHNRGDTFSGQTNRSYEFHVFKSQISSQNEDIFGSSLEIWNLKLGTLDYWTLKLKL